MNEMLDDQELKIKEAVQEISDGATEIYLICDEIGVEGATRIAEALKVNSTVTTLSLGDNEFGVEGACRIAEALEVNSTVTELDLSDNQIENEGTARIAEALKVNSTVTDLDLGDNEIGVEGAARIAEALKVNSTVTVLSLNENEIGVEGATRIAEALEMNSAVTELLLDSNQIGNEGAVRIAEALKVNSAVTMLSLTDNQIGDIGALSFAAYLNSSSLLEGLTLNGNPIGTSGILAIANAVKYGATGLRIITIAEGLKVFQEDKVSTNLKLIGEGNFGRALKGLVDGQQTVLKVPHQASSNDALYEYIMLHTLPEHKNVVKLIGYVHDLALEDTEEKGMLVCNREAEEEKKVAVTLAVELHENGSLKSHVEAQEGVRELKQFLQLALGMSEAIQHLHLHNHNILHRDIATRNYVLSDSSDPILIDFGLSCVVEEGGQPAVFGNKDLVAFRHCAPETLYLRRTLKKSDVWMIGVGFWQMLGIDKGEPFITFESPKSLREHLRERFLQKNYEFPLFFDHDIPTEIKELINFCCRFHHRDRPEIDEVIAKIKELQVAAKSENEHEGGESEPIEQFIEASDGKEGDLSVYGGGNYEAEGYGYLDPDNEGEGLEEYYSAIGDPEAAGQDGSDKLNEAKKGDLPVYASLSAEEEQGGLEENYSALTE